MHEIKFRHSHPNVFPFGLCEILFLFLFTFQVSMMDSLVTALDAELVVAGETMTRALGNRCRAAHAVLNEVTKVRRNG